MAEARHHSPSLNLIYQGMELYLSQRPEGKMFHDPLAACVTIDRGIAEFREVEMFREDGAWGARPAAGTGTFITIGVDRERFVCILLWPSG